MASPRTRRLMVDAESIRKRLAGWPLIEISGTAGIPPEIYRFTYRVKGLFVDPTGNILERNSHLLEVNLSLGYPRRAPQCRMLTPVFHPNFDDATVCIGDFWAASEGLDDLVIRIGRMIAYQEYNTKSPLNGLAAKWAEQNANLLPIDTRGIAPPSNDSTEIQLSHAEASVTPSGLEQSPLPIVANQVPVDSTHDPYIDPWSEKIVIHA
jgi:ubiquitin-protein ligase